MIQQAQELLEQAKSLWPQRQDLNPRTMREEAILEIMCTLIDQQAKAIIYTMNNMARLHSIGHKKSLPIQIADGLETIRRVLDYATSSDQARYNLMVWVKNAVDDLIAGRAVEEPPRGSKG